MSVNISSELMDYDVILASASPRRKELLSLMCENFRVIPSDCDEKIPEDVTPELAPEYLSGIKCRCIASVYDLSVVIGCDSSYFSYMTICSDCKITSSTLFSSSIVKNSLYDISCFFGVCNDSITIFKITVAITEITKNINNGFFSGERFFFLLSINVPPRFSSYLYITNIKNVSQ